MVGHGTNFENSQFETREFAPEFVSNSDMEFDHDLRIDLAGLALQDVVATEFAPKWSCISWFDDIDLREPPAPGARRLTSPMPTTETQSGDSIKAAASGRAQDSHASNPKVLLAAFAAVYLIWGSTFLAIRVGDESFPPLIVAGIRHFVFGLIAFPILLWKTKAKPTWAEWRATTVTGFLLLALGNGGVCLAEERVSSGVAALLVATVSLWMVLIDWLRPGGTRPVPRVIAGLVLGFSGLALLVGPKSLGGAGELIRSA